MPLRSKDGLRETRKSPLYATGGLHRRGSIMNSISNVPRSTAAVERPDCHTYDARDLIKDGVTACIVLDGQEYHLRITRAGKLILTK